MNFNEFLANFYFLQLLQAYTGFNGATSICVLAVVVHKVYVDLMVHGCTSSKKWFFRKFFSTVLWKTMQVRGPRPCMH
jgi:hypothetical protein